MRACEPGCTHLVDVFRGDGFIEVLEHVHTWEDESVGQRTLETLHGPRNALMDTTEALVRALVGEDARLVGAVISVRMDMLSLGLEWSVHIGGRVAQRAATFNEVHAAMSAGDSGFTDLVIGKLRECAAEALA